MSLMYCKKCKETYGPTVPCPTCGIMGERVTVSPPNIEGETFSEKLQKITADTDITDTKFIKLLQFVENHIATIEREARRQGEHYAYSKALDGSVDIKQAIKELEAHLNQPNKEKENTNDTN